MDNCAKCGKELDWSGRNAYQNIQLPKRYVAIQAKSGGRIGLKKEYREYKAKSLCTSCVREVLNSKETRRHEPSEPLIVCGE